MSLKISQGNYWLLFLLCGVLFNEIPLFTNSLSCDKVAILPTSFDLLLPDYQKLTKVHVSNYFFLDEIKKGSEDAGGISLRINIKENSVFKVQVTPRHAHLTMNVKSSNRGDTMSTTNGLPVDYTVLNPDKLISGDIYLTFSELTVEENDANESLYHSMTQDMICDTPYMLLEIYFEQYISYKEKISNVKSEVAELEEFSINFANAFAILKESEIKSGTTSSDQQISDLKVRKATQALEQYKLPLRTKQFYNKFNISVIDEFDLQIPDEELSPTINLNQTNSNHHIVAKLFLKIQMYSDFLLGGSFYFLLIHTSDLTQIDGYNCVYSGKCIVSEKPSKNSMILESVLTPGDYKVLLVNMNLRNDIHLFKKYLGLSEIPVTAAIKLKHSIRSENRFTCEGRRLPSSFDYLLNTTEGSNYLEYKGDIAINMETLNDEVDISLPDDSDYLMRVTTFFAEGNSIDLELYQIDTSGLNNIAANVNNQLDHVFDAFDSLYKGSRYRDQHKENLVGLSRNSGGTSSLYVPLSKGKRYRLVVNYKNSFFQQYQRKTCELFYMKLVLGMQSYLKSFFRMAYLPEASCLAITNRVREILTPMLENFENEHDIESKYLTTEYSQTSKEMRTYLSFGGNSVPEESNIKVNIIYTKKFKVKKSINFHIEVLSDYLTADIIPLIIPVVKAEKEIDEDEGNVTEIENFLNKKYKKFLLHESSVNLKLSKGKYMLILIHGLTQANNSGNRNFSGLLDQMSVVPKCLSFQIRIKSILLHTKKMDSWDCNYVHYSHLPDTIDVVNRDRYTYFSKNVLLPISESVIILETGKDGYVLRLSSQVSENSDITLDSSNEHTKGNIELEISLQKNNKVLSTAQKEILASDMISDIAHINFYLRPNIKYELHFLNKSKKNDIGLKYYDKCRIFMLEIVLVNEKALNNSNQCTVNIPSIENVIYERIIDINNSYSAYGKKTMLDMFSTSQNKATSQGTDIEVYHPKGSVFNFPIAFDKKSGMVFSYTFEIKSHLSRATLLIETPYAMPIPISATIRAIKEKETGREIVGRIIATEVLEDEGVLSIRGVLLEYGKYSLRIFVNQDLFNKKLIELFKSTKHCATFSASLLIENKPFDSFTKGANQKTENCPYLEFPDSLNLPGWIHPDTGDSINEFFRFKIKQDYMVKKFVITKRSIFKFYLPSNRHNNFHSYISLYKLRGNNSQKLIEILEKDNNYISTVLNKGRYSIEFKFSLNEKGNIFGYQKNKFTPCYFFDVYIAVQPSSHFIGGIDSVFTRENAERICENKQLPSGDEIAPNSHIERHVLKFPNTSAQRAVRTFKLKPLQNTNGKFVGEMIFNHYSDPVYKIYAYRFEKNPDDVTSNHRVEIRTDLIVYENFIWVAFHCQKNTEYLIEIVSGKFDNHSMCSSVVFSYTYEEISSSNNDEEYLAQKDQCQLEDYLPNNFYINTNHILDKYGGPQSIEDGELRFYGEFLLPKSSPSVRAEFMIKSKSIVFIKLDPLYEKASHNNIFMELFKYKNEVFRLSHNNSNGIMITELSDLKAYWAKAEGESIPYYIDFTFDRVLSNCEAYQLIFCIIPKATYTDDYMSCNRVDTDEKDFTLIPDALQITDKSQQFSYQSAFTLTGAKAFSQMSSWVEGNSEKTIALALSHATSFTIVLSYIASNNMMDVLLEDSDGTQLELAREKIKQEASEIRIYKEISVYLKKGTYKLKLVFHKMFAELLNNIFEKELNGFCFYYLLEIEANILKLKNENNISNEDEDNTQDQKITHLSKLDFTLGNSKVNVITSVDPIRRKKLKLGTSMEIELRFAYDIENNNTYTYSDMIYLQEKSNTNAIKIYPLQIYETRDNIISFTFDIDRNKFQLKKCYKLFLDEKFKNIYDDQAIDVDGLDRIYCTMKCECNPSAKYSCDSNDKCKCKHPYTGVTCEACKEGFAKSNSGTCVDTKIADMKCDEKVTCSGYGKCISPNSAFNPYKNENPCKCLQGFTSSIGYPSVKFCDTCLNPAKAFPFCSETADSLKFTFQSSCEEMENAPSLPHRLYAKVNSKYEDENTTTDDDPDLAYFDGGQDIDGSIDLSAVLLVKDPEEYSEFIIRENSLIRVFYQTQEINRARVLILSNKNDQTSIADTDGQDISESFIAKLTARARPYVLKVLHTNLKPSCNRYQLKIVIRTLKVALSELKCKSHVNVKDVNSLLPPSTVVIDNSASVIFADKVFYIPDFLILDPQKYKAGGENQLQLNFTQPGILTNGEIDSSFDYSIKLDIKAPVTFSASTMYDFLTADITLSLRNSTGQKLESGHWLISEAIVHASDHDFINMMSIILDPGIYYLTLTQNVAANHILQMIYDSENLQGKNIVHISRCFKFNLHLQISPINKPDPGISTAKFESMYNRIVSVEPESTSTININKNFQIFITFEQSISPKLNPKFSDQQPSLSFTDVFYFQNSRTGAKLPPSHVYLQGRGSKTFLIIYEENTLAKEECYELKYILEYLQSLMYLDQKVTGDAPIIHNYCTKSCNCNPQTNFECDKESGKCICDEPYTGDGCTECIAGWVMARGKCITDANCSNSFCSGYGKCVSSGLNVNISHPPKCECDKSYNGYDNLPNVRNDCSYCTDMTKVFPECIQFDATSKSTDDSEFNKFLSADNEEFSTIDSEEYKCAHTFLPHNLDSLGYLHLDGNMHITGKYSLKHISNKHYTMAFTIKEPSHIKIFIEHSKKTHTISMFLLDNAHKYLHRGSIYAGPAGAGSSTLLDFVANPIIDGTMFKNYEIAFFIKDITKSNDDIVPTYEEASNAEVLTSECFTVFMEMQVMTLARESNVVSSLNKDESCIVKKERIPILIPHESSLFEYHILNPSGMGMRRYNSTHIRSGTYHRQKESADPSFFYYDYFYIPDHLDQEMVIELQVDSKFLNSHVGVLLEIIEIPTSVKTDHKKLTSKDIAEIYQDKDKDQLISPSCHIHCFTGVKKYNSVVLNRILPSDTFFRIWFYDLSPSPFILGTINYTLSNALNSCILYQLSFRITNLPASKKSFAHKKESALCLSNELPASLNIKDYLGDHYYRKKWGFHVLDSFRIDRSIDNGSMHKMEFEIDEYHLLRILVLPGRVDTDLDLMIVGGNGEESVIARSNSKDFEEAIVIEIPPGKYKIVFKFFPPASGYLKCEAVRMELAMAPFHVINEDLTRMTARYKNKPKFTSIDFHEHIANEREIFTKDYTSVRYAIPLEPPFTINVDDIQKFVSSISIAEFTFTISPEDSNKIEFIAFASSNFLYIDASVYMSYSFENSSTPSKIISSTHRKNMNILSTGRLESGTYVTSLRYYRRLHYKPTGNNLEYMLYNANFAEVEFDAMMINKSNDDVKILTSAGSLKIPPANTSQISHNWLCRNAGLPVPKSLSSLRYLEFSSSAHILDTFIIPPMGEGEDKIRFHLQFTPKMLLRVYVECHTIDIDIELREKTRNGYVTIAKSSENVHFETFMTIIHDENEYEIVVIYKGIADKNNVNFDDTGASTCRTFKMEIALEADHGYACPESAQYARLTDLKPIPGILPVAYSSHDSIYRYNSRDIYKGEDYNSGYVYMLRKEKDEVIEFSSFSVHTPIDLKIEIVNDFIQAPINILLASKGKTEEGALPASGQYTLAAKAFGLDKLNDAFILEYGEIFENRSILLIKNLPTGEYSIYVYIPGMRTTFTNEMRVCSLYDILVEIKTSRNHFKATEIINTSEIMDDNLDIPVMIPETLNNLRFMSGYGPYTYVNYADDYYLRYNQTNIEKENQMEHYDMYNSFTFTVPTESLVEFYITHDIHKERLQVSILGHAKYSDYLSVILKEGQYTGMIRLEKVKREDYKQIRPDEAFIIDSIYHLINFYIGISPVSRIKDIYMYNNIQSTYRQCQSQYFPSVLDYDTQTSHYSYHNEFFTLRLQDLANRKTIGSFTVTLNKFESNRILCEIGSDYVLNKLSLKVVLAHSSKTWRSSWLNNVGELDITVPKGTYTFEMEVTESILTSEYECIIFSIDIHIIDANANANANAHPVYSKHILGNDNDSSHSKANLLKMKCDGGVLPLEIYKNADVEFHRIKNNGEYFLHMSKVTYFVNRHITKSFDNVNEIDINLSEDSLVRITTSVENPKEFQVIPKMKIYARNIQESENKQIYLTPNLSSLSHNMKERNALWVLERNKHETDEFYTLELLQERYEQLKESMPSFHCPYYGIDVLIHPIVELVKKFECLSENGNVVEYILPKSQLNIFKQESQPYHEKISMTYFTEKQYREYFVTSESYYGINYPIFFTIEGSQFYISLSLGFDSLISLFEVYLSKYAADDVARANPQLISLGMAFFDKADESFPYKRVLQTTLTPGTYSIFIGETLWADVSRTLKSRVTTSNKNLSLCIPFSYSLDIVSANDNLGIPEILSIFPPGPIVFKHLEEDMNIRLVLSKAPFTKKKEPVTAIYNFMAVVNSFYLTKIPTTTGRLNENKNKNKHEMIIIHPDKVQGNANAKEWDLLFLQNHFEPNFDYELHFEDHWIFDINSSQFHQPKVMPVIRIETSREDIFNFVDSLTGMKPKMNEGEFTSEKKSEEVVSVIQGDMMAKCGLHGKYVFDNILNKYLCTCIDGFTGKFCQICNGEEIKGKCMEVEDEDDTNTSESSSEESNVRERSSTQVSTSYCGGCTNGICDVKTGRCICEKGYSGRHCEKAISIGEKKVVQSPKVTTPASYSKWELIFKFL